MKPLLASSESQVTVRTWLVLAYVLLELEATLVDRCLLHVRRPHFSTDQRHKAF